jgi:sterol desaturase/sphingolipid hydroxylase (fatty acid hydroxylase superfamily)
MERAMAVLVPVTFAAMVAVERLRPARALPKVRFWYSKGALFFVVRVLLSSALPALAADALSAHALVHLGWMGTACGGFAGFALADGVSYGVHRLEHNVPLLWRFTHQMHHSAERLDVIGAFYSHPLDLAVQATLNLAAVAALGLTPGAAALAGYLSVFAGSFQHMNVRTPRWIGYVLQRPEAHAVHHTRGVHAYNYGSFMLWDLLFGTFRNPARFACEPAGFWDGASAEVGAMLLGRDVGDPPRGRRTTPTIEKEREGGRR